MIRLFVAEVLYYGASTDRAFRPGLALESDETAFGYRFCLVLMCCRRIGRRIGLERRHLDRGFALEYLQ